MNGAEVVEVVRTTHLAGDGTESDPLRTVTTWWSKAGERLWTEHPADTPRTPKETPFRVWVASRQPTVHEVEEVLIGAGVPYMTAGHPDHRKSLAYDILGLWRTPGCRVCGAGVPEGATECGSDHK